MRSLTRSIAVVWMIHAAAVTGFAEVTITRQIKPGRPFTPADQARYEPAAGVRYVVDREHRIPDDMVVQGDTVVLQAQGSEPSNATDIQWTLRRAAGRAQLRVDPADPRTARFLADGYGENLIQFEATVAGRRITRQAAVGVEFSTENMLVSGETIPLPPDADSNPFVRPFRLTIRDHREQVTARNPQTGRLVTLWQVKYGGGDACPMGIGVMVSDDHGLTWKDKRFLFIQEPSNSGWGSIGWNPRGNGGQGEMLIWASSHVRSEGNRLMLFRSRDNAQTWQHVGDFQAPISRLFGRPHAMMIYFGVNRTIAIHTGRLISPMISHDSARVIWSDDDGRTWNGSNLDSSFPRGNEDALIETVNGGKLVLMARPGQGSHNRRFESSDGGRSWAATPDCTLPTAGANFGLDRIDMPGNPEHGRILYSAAATRVGPHKGRQRLVVAINNDPIHVDRGRWETRLLWDAVCNYSDILYVPEDKSVLVTVETVNPGVSTSGYAAIRYFKMSLRYWRHLPQYEACVEPPPKLR